MFYYIISKMSDMRPFINPILFMKISPICFTVFYRGYPIQNIQKIGYRYFLFKLKKKEIPISGFTVFYRGYPNEKYSKNRLPICFII